MSMVKFDHFPMRARPSRHSNLRLFEGGSCDISGVSFVISGVLPIFQGFISAFQGSSDILGDFFRHLRDSSDIFMELSGFSKGFSIFSWI
jgi:hypothetical protein